MHKFWVLTVIWIERWYNMLYGAAGPVDVSAGTGLRLVVRRRAAIHNYIIIYHDNVHGRIIIYSYYTLSTVGS